MAAKTASPFKIRPYRDADFETLVALWRDLGMLFWYNDPKRDIALWQKSENAEILIGELKGSPVASICVGHDGHRGWVYYLAVAGEHQRKGFGRRLIKVSEDWLRQRGVPKTQLLVRPTNRQANAFYESIGYDLNPCTIWQKWLIDRGTPPEGAEAKGSLEVTITYLEMTERPQFGPDAPHLAGHRVGLLRAERPTLSFYRFLYNTVGREWLWYERRKMSDEALRALIEDERVEIYVLYAEGVPAGFFELDAREQEVVNIALMGVMPEFIGRGYGPFLLRSAIEMAWDKAPGKLTVNTCTLDHPKALPLYQKMGFVPVSRKTIRIDDPRETGLIPV